GGGAARGAAQLAARGAPRGDGVPGADAVGKPAGGQAAGRAGVRGVRAATRDALVVRGKQKRAPRGPFRCGELQWPVWNRDSGTVASSPSSEPTNSASAFSSGRENCLAIAPITPLLRPMAGLPSVL